MISRTPPLHLSSLRTQGPITTGLRFERRLTPRRHQERSRGMGPCVRRDDGVGCSRTPHTPLSSPGLTGRPSTPRPIASPSGFPAYWIPAFAGMTSGGGTTSCGRTHTLPTSSPRTRGPIATGFRDDERSLPLRFNETTRRMGPCVRRDDGVGCSRTPHTPLSSPGLTGRPSTPRPIASLSGFSAYWIPAFAGMTNGGGTTSCGRTHTLPPSSPRTRGPITTGFRDDERSLPLRFNETAQRLGPCERRDDGERTGH